MTFYIDKLKPGMIVSRDVYSTDGKVCILRAGIVLTESMINSLVKHKIEKVDIDLSPAEKEMMKFDRDVVETISEEDKLKAYNAIVTQSVKDIVKSAESIVEKVVTSDTLEYSLSQYKTMDEDAFKRSVRVAVFAVAVGRTFNFLVSKAERESLKQLDLKNLAEASLLYSIGLICQDKRELQRITNPKILPESIFTNVNPKAFLTYDPEMITLYSYNILNSMSDPNINEALKMSVVVSMEQPNGKGALGAIPSYMHQSKTNIWSGKIIKACEEYDKILQEVINKEESLNNVIEIMAHKQAEGVIDPIINELVFRTIPLYSKGCKVCLSDGRYAVVELVNRAMRDRPVVKIVGTNEVINLASSTNLTISKVVGREVSFYDIANELSENPDFGTKKM